MERIGTSRQLVGSDDELQPFMLLLKWHKLVVGQGGSSAFEESLHLRIVEHGEGLVDFKLDRGHKLDCAVFLGSLFQRAVLLLEVEVLAAENALKHLDQSGLAGVGHTIDPDHVDLRI